MTSGIDLPPPPPPPPLPAALADAEFELPASEQVLRTCPNCGAPAHGPYCYACGQSEKGMIRHLSEVLVDLADIVFNVDSRVFRSLGDLYFRPGYLTTEYFAGRRARYVTPFRLFFFLSIIAFFAIQASLPEIKPDDIQFGEQDSIAAAATPEEVNKQVERMIGPILISKNVPGIDARTAEKLDARMAKVRERGEQRLKELAKLETAKAAGQEPVAEKEEKSDITLITLNGKPWSLDDNPVHIDWLSEGLNARINRTLQHMQENLESIKKDPSRLLAGWIAVLPQTLFVVMPLFAVLLKFFYLFKRRLYMEHLLVALHSHAFIFMSILVLLLIGVLNAWASGIAWLQTLFSVLTAAAWIWLFLYLLLMQKRVYRQGWFMTVLKYCVIGLSYTIFLSVALVFSALISLALT
jgi:hypothetical protein